MPEFSQVTYNYLFVKGNVKSSCVRNVAMWSLFCHVSRQASSAPPGAMELSSLVKQCAEILHLVVQVVQVTDLRSQMTLIWYAYGRFDFVYRECHRDIN